MRMNRIRYLREELNFTQENLANKIGISRQVLSNYENEINQPSPEILIKLADNLQCSIDYLLGREDDFGNITIQTEKPAPLPQDEQTLLNNFRKLPQDLRHRAAVYMQNLADAAEEESFNFHGGKNYGNKTKTL